MSRSFTIESVSRGNKRVNFNGGRYINDSPMNAAKKAFSKACQDIGTKGKCTMKITMRETTAGSAKKEFSYKVTRIYNPVSVERDGEMVLYKYSVKIQSI
jgi:hypothetical protein